MATATKPKPKEAKNRPVHEIRFGRIRAAIWQNETEVGTRHNVTISRLYKDGDGSAIRAMHLSDGIQDGCVTGELLSN